MPTLRLPSLASLVRITPFLVSPLAFGAFLHTDAGPYDYATTANWSGGTIDNTWSTSLTANQSITFAADTTLSGALTIANTALFNHTFTGSGANRTLSLGGNISLANSATNANTVTLGSTTDGQKLNVSLGAASRTLGVGTNRTLDIVNAFSGTGSLSKQGLGTLKLTHTANSYTGGTNIGVSGQSSGVIEVTKLANGGLDSSIGKSSNSTTSLVFGGTTAGGGTLRYVGSGDSTDRRFLIGGTGAVFDASGTGALLWTNTASADVSPSSGQARTITLKGTSTHDNTMSVSFGDSGAGKTSFTKTGTGTWVLAGNNTATGDITVTQGTLALGASDRLGNTASLVLNGGTFASRGFDETLGTLALTAGSTLDLGSGDSDLVFSDSSAVVWTEGPSISLTIINFTDGVDSIRIGINGSALTSAQIEQITINGFNATLDSSGFLTISTVPEPSSYAVLAGVGGLLAATVRRRRQN